jgi:hypothetical protein
MERYLYLISNAKNIQQQQQARSIMQTLKERRTPFLTFFALSLLSLRF